MALRGKKVVASTILILFWREHVSRRSRWLAFGYFCGSLNLTYHARKGKLVLVAELGGKKQTTCCLHGQLTSETQEAKRRNYSLKCQENPYQSHSFLRGCFCHLWNYVSEACTFTQGKKKKRS